MTNVTVGNNSAGRVGDHFDIEAAVIVSFFFVWLPGIVLNIIALVFITRDLRKAVFPAVVLLFILCLYDLLAVILSLIQHVLDAFLEMSETLCAVSTFFFSYFTISAGILNCLMAVDRAMAICAPFYYKMRIEIRTWAITCVGVGVATAFYSAFPMIGLGDIWSIQNGEKTCNLGYQAEPWKRVYGMVYGIFGFLSIGMIVVFNTLLIKTLFKMRKSVVCLQTSTTESSASTETTETARRESFEIVFAKMMICLSVAYIIFGTPTKVLFLQRERFDSYCCTLKKRKESYENKANYIYHSSQGLHVVFHIW